MSKNKIRECPRHGGPWGDDETCTACTDEQGQPRPVPTWVGLYGIDPEFPRPARHDVAVTMTEAEFVEWTDAIRQRETVWSLTMVNPDNGYVSVCVKRAREQLVDGFIAALSGWVDGVEDDEAVTVDEWITVAENNDFKPAISEHEL